MVAGGLPATRTGDLGDDIANILKGVKLPERRDAPPAEKKPIENKAAVFDTDLGAAASAETKASATQPAASVAAPEAADQASDADKNPSSVVSVHTLKDDLRHVVRDQKISVVRAASLEQDKRVRRAPGGDDPPRAPRRPSRAAGVLFTAGMLLVLGAAAMFGVYAFTRSSAAPAPQQQSGSSILFAESSVTFPLDNQSSGDLKRALAGARASLQGALGSITAIIPTVAAANPDASAGKRPATFAEFMNAIGAHPPESLLRALGSNFFFGIHTVDINAPVLVIPVTSYDRAFAGMLSWEPAINPDLAPIFTAVPVTATDANGLPVHRAFQDNVKRNYDVRELKDDSGQVRLYYSFPTQNILIIAESPYSFAEILSRLQAQREL